MSEFIVVAGMSGAGRTTVANTLEDLGWYVVDNLPPAMIPQMADLKSVVAAGPDVSRIALIVGRTQWHDQIVPAIDELKQHATAVRIVYLEAEDDILIQRYEEKRRRHPMKSPTGVIAAVGDSIAAERVALDKVRAVADIVIDTAELNVHQLRDRVIELFAPDRGIHGLVVTVVSFGFRYGLPRDADMVLDVRFLPNPHWIPELRPQTGQDAAVRDYLMEQDATGRFLHLTGDLLAFLLPQYVEEGKSYLTIAVGCTGGQHRSVAMAEAIGTRIAQHGFRPRVVHRDVVRRTN